MQETNYVLGHSDSELRRLRLQGRIFAPGTERMLRAAGLDAGQSVLDIGTGAGDVALIAAVLTGSSGSVLGIDREASVLELARSRAKDVGLDYVRYETASLDRLNTDQRFDFVVGRYVLVHQPNEVAFVEQAARFVRPGGTLLFIEPDFKELASANEKLGEAWSNPPVALYDETMRHSLVALMFAGAHVSRGGSLVGAFHAAGLPEPAVLQEVPMAGPDSAFVEWMCLNLRSLLPVLEQHGVTTAAQVGIETLQERMQAAVSEAHSQLRFANLVGAWAKVG